MQISAVIPTHNRATVLERALASVLTQTHPAMEVIVVDDGSEDRTRELLTQKFPSVRYLHQPNQGVSSARNLGIANARGDWIAFLDSDDEWLPGKLQAQKELLSNQPDIRICHTEEIWIRDGKRVNQMKKHTKQGGTIFRHCLPLCVISPSSVMIHRDVFEQVGVFDESLPACEDYDLWLRICARYPVAFVEQPQINKYGGHEDQLSRRHWGMDRFRLQALEKIIVSGEIQGPDLEAASEMLTRKAAILANGAEKRGKHEEAARYRALQIRYTAVCA
ncbi:MAG: glycosyltransferase family A protein [Candidatus Sedimenticola sp. 20ELBAFRAG]